ncbi:MAG: tetratricopeptide repeat protein [Blastocatellia bacterium]
MKRLFPLAFVACAVVLLAASSAPAKDKWIGLRTKNFNIVSNGDEGDTRQLALKLEQFRVIISKLTNTSLVAPVPITVVVFKSDGAFKPFKPLYNGKPANLSGFFQRSEDENLIALDMNARAEHPMAVIFHEYTHLFTAYTPIAWPVWLKEGVAEFYSTFDVKKNEVSIGKPLTHHVMLLRENKFVPFETLFSVAHSSPVYNERDKQGVFYAESWALVHYLMYGNNHARQPQLIQFVLSLGRGVNVERAFSEAFKTDFATMEKELRRYIGKDSYPGMIFTMDSTEGEKEVSVRSIPDAEVQYNLGNLLMRIDRLEDAEGYFGQAIALDSKLAGPYEGRGFVAMRRNKYSEAKDHFKQAAALGSQNHLVHYYYAESLQRELMGDRGSVSLIHHDLAETMIDELKTSIKLMPGFAPAYNLLAFVYLASGERLGEGIDALKTALGLEPQNRRFALTLAQLQLRMQDYAAAKKTIEPLLTEDDEPGVKAQAQSILSLIESYSRRDTSASSFQAGQPPAASSTEPKERPRLRRKGDEATGQAEPSIDKPDRVFSTAKPTKKFAGTEVMAGTLAAIECGAGMVLAVKAGENLLRFTVTDPNKLQFLTQDPQLNPRIGCGPINLAAFIHYKPVSGGKFSGDAVAVEFRK